MRADLDGALGVLLQKAEKMSECRTDVIDSVRVSVRALAEEITQRACRGGWIDRKTIEWMVSGGELHRAHECGFYDLSGRSVAYAVGNSWLREMGSCDWWVPGVNAEAALERAEVYRKRLFALPVECVLDGMPWAAGERPSGPDRWVLLEALDGLVEKGGVSSELAGGLCRAAASRPSVLSVLGVLEEAGGGGFRNLG